MLDVYGLRQCNTTRKALRHLDASDVSYRFHDVRADPPDRATLERALGSGVPLKRFFNTSGRSYRQGGYKDRASHMTSDEAVDAFVSDPMLLKRPLVVGEGVMLVGFREDEYRASGL